MNFVLNGSMRMLIADDGYIWGNNIFARSIVLLSYFT
jgi:hypothetical protein